MDLCPCEVRLGLKFHTPKNKPIKIYRLFYPQTAVVIAARAADHVEATAINSVISGSSKPQRVVCALKSDETVLATLRESKSFSVNWMDSRFAESVDFLGFRRVGKPKDKIKAAGLNWLPGSKTSAPVVSEAEATLECKLDEVVPLGDNELVIGNVVSARTSGDFSDYWQFKTYEPLVYIGAVPGKMAGKYVQLESRRRGLAGKGRRK